MDTLADLKPDFLCTDVSIAMDEALYGTAVHATTWFILEYRASWRAKAPHDNDLPPSINNWLTHQLEHVENGRLQFIRRKNEVGSPLAFYIAITKPDQQRLYHFEVATYAELLNLDVPAILAGNANYEAHRSNQPLIFVCTHGKRDRCCALLGLPILKALKKELGEAVWQTTHTGGHRFAPTLLTFPDGACYGRLTAADVPQLLDALSQKGLLLEKMRGRTCFTAVEQVADYVLRHETGKSQLEAFTYLSTQPLNDNRWAITFAEAGEEQVHSLIIEKDPQPLTLYASSGKYKVKEIAQYTFVSHEIGLTTP